MFRNESVRQMSRRARELTDEQRTVVDNVRRVAGLRSNANANYVSAILHAREQGITYAAIAEAAGTSSQAVQEIVRRHRGKAEARNGTTGKAGDVAAISEPDGQESGPIASSSVAAPGQSGVTGPAL